MRIIEQGRARGRFLRGRCDSCEALVEAEFTDPEVKQEERAKSSEYTSTPYYVDCPTPKCGSRLWLWETEGVRSEQYDSM